MPRRRFQSLELVVSLYEGIDTGVAVSHSGFHGRCLGGLGRVQRQPLNAIQSIPEAPQLPAQLFVISLRAIGVVETVSGVDEEVDACYEVTYRDAEADHRYG